MNGCVADTYKPELMPYQRDVTYESKAFDHAQFPVVGPKFNNLALRNGLLDSMCIDQQVVAPAPGLQHYWAEPAELGEISRIKIMWPTSSGRMPHTISSWAPCP